MDFTLKGKSWAGSIYNQFESICHDVDGFMTKDTVQYLENRVQRVGKSVKRLYSSVKDMTQSLEEDDRVKSEAQQVHDDEDEIKDQINAVTNITKNPPSFDDTIKNSMDSLTVDESKSQPIDPESCQVAKTDAVREDHNHATTSDPVDLTTSSGSDAKKERISFTTFSYYPDCYSDASTSGWSFEDNLSFFEDPKTNTYKIPSSQSVSFADKACQCNGSVIDSEPTSDFDATGKEGAIYHNILTSYSNISESPSENYITHSESSTPSSGVVNLSGCSCNSLDSSFATLYCESKAMDLHINDIDGLIDLSTDAKPDLTTIVSGSNFVRSASSYRRKNFRYYKGLMKNAIASRKRLSKEYEHLAIMYGDIDTELLQDLEPSSLPSSSLPLEMQENEWELL